MYVKAPVMFPTSPPDPPTIKGYHASTMCLWSLQDTKLGGNQSNDRFKFMKPCKQKVDIQHDTLKFSKKMFSLSCKLQPVLC